jgi:hypothetical protein
VWALQFLEAAFLASVRLLTHYQPPFSWLILFILLLAIAAWHQTLHFWQKYRNVYYLKHPPLNWVDALLALLLPTIVWSLLNFPELYSSRYAICIGSIFISYIVITYIAGNWPQAKRIWISSKSESNPKDVVKLFSDDPIDGEGEDLIGRSKFATTLKEHIYTLSFKQSFVIGLYGYWGEGKTSVLNLLRHEISKENKILTYEFSPWFFSNSDAITENFYKGLEDFLSQYYFIPRRIKKSLKFYPEVLIKGFASVSFGLSGETEDRPKKLKEELERFLGGLDKRVLVVIDDIDRLQKEDIQAVFRLVKLTSHIKNLVFLLSFDPSIVASRLGDLEGGAQSYIEKIVQLPIHLPMTDQAMIGKFLFFSYPANNDHRSEIDKILDKIGLDSGRRKEFDDQFTKIYQSELQEIFSTLRSAKRYLNSIKFRLPFVEREVFLFDFFVVEILQTFFPHVYADIKLHPQFYVSQWSLMSQAYPRLPYDKDARYKAIREHVEGVIGIKSKNFIVSLLENIFPELKNAFLAGGRGRVDYDNSSGEYRIKKRVAHPDCFPKYFMLGVREGVIPDAEFEDTLRFWVDSEEPEKEIGKSFFLKYQKEERLIELIELLKLHAGHLDGKLVVPLIRAIYKNSKKFSREGSLWYTEYDQVSGLLFRLVEDNPGIPPENVHSIFEEIVSNTQAADFTSLVVFSARESRQSLPKITQNIRVGELRDILADRLTRHYIQRGLNIFDRYPNEREFGFILYQWALRWGDKEKNHKEEVTDYLMALSDKKPETLGYYLNHFAKTNFSHETKRHFDFASFEKAYDVDKFYKQLQKLGTAAYKTESEKEAIELMIQKHEKVLMQRAESQQPQLQPPVIPS